MIDMYIEQIYLLNSNAKDKIEICESVPDPTDPYGKQWVREFPPRLVSFPRIHRADRGQPVESHSILIRLFLLSSILLARIAAHLPASLFPRLLPRTVCAPREGARGRRRRRRTSREPEPSVHRISQSPLRDCAGTSVCGNCRARSRR